MKKFLFIFLSSLVGLYFISNGSTSNAVFKKEVTIDTFINKQTMGSATTLSVAKGGIRGDSALILPFQFFTDTSQANFTRAAGYMGSLIRVGNVMWMRGSSFGNNTPNKWYEFAITSSTGTVTSITQGYGIANSPNPITTVGTITTDTTVIVSKSYFSNFNVLNVKYADTSAMLSPYLRKSDTTQMLNGYVRGIPSSINNGVLKWDGTTGNRSKKSNLIIEDYFDIDASLVELYGGVDSFGNGREVSLNGSDGTVGTGGAAFLVAGLPANGNGSNAGVYASRGRGTNKDGGSIFLDIGGKTGSGNNGSITISMEPDSSGFSTLKRGFIRLDSLTTTPNGVINARTWQMPNASGTLALRGDTTYLGNFVRLQTGNLFRQDGKTWISDTMRTSGVGQFDSHVRTDSINSSILRMSGNIRLQNNQGIILRRSDASTSTFLRLTTLDTFNIGVTDLPTVVNGSSTRFNILNLFSQSLQQKSGLIALTSDITDSSSALRSAINTKLNISDTSGMLTNYLRKSDTATMLLGYTRVNRFLDTTFTLRALINTKGTGTVTSVGITAGTGISVSGSPITSSGSITVTNSAPDQTVTLTNGGNITISGTYPNFTLTNGITNNNQLTNGAGYITSSSLSGYVPYTGATTNVNLGSNTITAGGATLTGALAGTSAGFSGNLSSGNTIFANGAITESSGYQLNAITMGYSTTGTYGWVTAGGAASRTSLVLNAGGGNVGIGTTSPNYKMTISPASNYTAINTGDGLQIDGNAGIGTSQNLILGVSSTYGSAIQARNSTSSSVLALNPFGGNVGIGTTAPSTKFEVSNGTIRSSGTGNGFNLFTASSSRGSLATYDVISGAGTDYTPTLFSESNIYFAVNGTATRSMTLNTSGRLLVGTTTDDGSSRVQVSGNVLSTGNYTSTNSDARFTGGDAVGRAVFANSTTSTYAIAYGASHASVANTYVIATNSALALTINASQAATFSSSVTAKHYTNNTTSVSTTYSVANDIGVVFADATSGNFTITLPTASSWTGRVVYIKRTDCTLANSITISGATDNGSLGVRDGAIYISNGSTWYCIAIFDGSTSCA